MTAPEQDWRLWQWLSGLMVAVVGGLAGGGWTARGLLESLRRENEAQSARIAALEKQQDHCSANLRKVIAETVQQTLTASELRHAEQQAAINRDVAVITALFKETQADVREIFSRLNVRLVDIPVETNRRKPNDPT